MNKSVFFAEVRKSLFGGKLTESQVEGIEALIDAMNEEKWFRSWQAYALATAFHETGKLFAPVKEGFTRSDAWRKANLRYYPWYGRGLVQLTWKANYEKASKAVGVDFIANPDAAMELDNSIKILIWGMEGGTFTGRSLHHYLKSNNGTMAQFIMCRYIINIQDKARQIAEYAIKFQDALIKAGA